MQKKNTLNISFSAKIPQPSSCLLQQFLRPFNRLLGSTFLPKPNESNQRSQGGSPSRFSIVLWCACVYCVLCFVSDTDSSMWTHPILHRPGINYSQPHLSFFLISIPMFSAQDTPHLKISLLCNSVFWSEIFWLVLFSSLPKKQN